MRTEIDEYGTIFYYNEKNQLHREGGLPAIEGADGSKVWFVDGKHHRDGGLPAVEYADGYKAWYVDGKNISEEHAKALQSNTHIIKAAKAYIKHFKKRNNITNHRQINNKIVRELYIAVHNHENTQ